MRGAEPGDILEVRIIDVKPRPSANPNYPGKAFGSNAAAWWGFHYKELLTEPKPREVITIYEIDATGQRNWAKARLQFPVDAADRSVRRGAQDHRLSRRAGRSQHDQGEPRHPEERAHSDPAAFRRDGRGAEGSRLVDSIPPGYFGGNIDNWRIGKGATMYYPVAVPGALFSIGDSHASQGDSELCGTAIECSLTGTFQLILHKKATLAGTSLAELELPAARDPGRVGAARLQLRQLSRRNSAPTAQQTIYEKSSVDLALKDAFRKMRAFLMTTKGLTEDEAISLMSIAVDFGVTQVVDGNWGVHAIIKKSLFAGAEA